MKNWRGLRTASSTTNLRADLQCEDQQIMQDDMRYFFTVQCAVGKHLAYVGYCSHILACQCLFC